MSTTIATLRADIEFALARIAPDLRDSWSRDVESRFTAWQALPEFPQHQGTRKLISEFYVRALSPASFRDAFYDARNVVLDYFDASYRELDDVHSLTEEQWRCLAKELPSLFVRPIREP